MVVVLGLRNAAPIQRHLGPWHPVRKEYRVGETGQQSPIVAPTVIDIHIRDSIARMRNQLECKEAVVPRLDRKIPPESHTLTDHHPPRHAAWLLPCATEQVPAKPAGSVKRRYIHSDPTPQERVLKRRRPASDVDGPNTATLGCKKRRLRRHLITSRLSQPFSLPATHILNREAVASGDKRFLKLAAAQAARRLNLNLLYSNNNSTMPPPPPSPHSSACSPLLRAATANRVWRRVRQSSGAIMRGFAPAEIAAHAAMSAQVHSMGLSIGGRFPAAATTAAAAGLPPGYADSVQKVPLLMRQAAPHHANGPTKPPSKIQGVCGTLSPGKAPRPWQRSLHHPCDLDDDLDEDGMAFPGTAYDGKYETSDDHDDDVYADFGVLFGGGAEGDGGGGQEETEHYEDYMDDLDGIPWHVR